MGKNIAILINSISGGGAERVASILSNYLASEGYKVYFFVDFLQKQNTYLFSGEVIPLNVMRYDNLIKKHISIERICSILEKSIKIRKLKKQYNIHVSISFMEEYNYINVLSRYRDKVVLRVCTILSARNDLEKSIMFNPVIMRHFYNRADKIVVMTKYAKKDMIDNWGIKQNKLCIIPNPVDFGSHRADNPDTLWNFGDKVILTVNRFAEVKQQWHIIRAFSELAKKDPEARLIMLGGGENGNYLKSLARQLGIQEQVHFLGFQKNVYYYLSRSRAYVLTSRTEGFPNSMVEAMDAGTCIISVDCPGAPREILAPDTKYDGKLKELELSKYGILVPTLDGKKYSANVPLTLEEKKLFQAMDKVVSDNALYKKYQLAGKNRVKKFSINRIGPMWSKMIQLVLN